MSTGIENGKAGWLQILSALIVLLAISVSVEAQEARSSNTEHFVTGGRDGQGESTKTTDQYAELVSEGQREKPSYKSESRTAATGESGTAAASLRYDFWIYDADVILFSDDDGDGHYYGIDLLFDADTIYVEADVYAAVYLSFEGGPWNEYAVTEDFTISGATDLDEYVLVTELMSGYPRGRYDLLIELFDAVDGSYLASFGPEDTTELMLLPLEDFNRDEPGYDTTITTVTTVTVSSGHGGSGAAGLPMLAALLAIVAGRRRRIRRSC